MNETQKKQLLIVDDDVVFLNRLALSMERKGFEVFKAENIAEAKKQMDQHMIWYALIDLKLGTENGLDIVQMLNDICPKCHIVVLTAFGNIASAVNAIKYGATDYLAKPASADAIENALLSKDVGQIAPPPDKPMPADRVKWEHILRVYEQTGHNVSETARLLGMHRRTLQRILSKRAPYDERE